MKTYTVKFVVDKVTEDETSIVALDETKAYLEFMFHHPAHYEIIEIVHNDNQNRCLYCNEIIPEGRQICKKCEGK